MREKSCACSVRLSVIINPENGLAMDIRESIISSFFFHLILFLLMLAAANYTAGVSMSNRNIITIDLALPDSKDRSAAPGDLSDRPPADLSALPDDTSQTRMSLPNLAAGPPPKESEIVPEPAKKAESEAGPTKIETTEQNSIRTEGFTSPEAYYEFIILHKKIFREQAGVRVNELLGEAFKVNKREFYGGTAVVNLKFGTDRTLKEVLVSSSSPELKSFLDEIVWDAIPPPAAYSIGNAGVRIEFAVHEGSMSFTINAL